MDFLAAMHPKVVHFPIVLFILYGVAEIIAVFTKKEFFEKAAFLLLGLGILGAIAAVLTGNQAHDVAMQAAKAGAAIPRELLEDHEDLANYTLWFFVFTGVFRTYLVLKKKFVGNIRYIFVLLALIGFFLVYETGEHGGKLVYEHGVGTEMLKSNVTNYK